MKVCSKCGNDKLIQGIRYCLKCGADIENNSVNNEKCCVKENVNSCVNKDVNNKDKCVVKTRLSVELFEIF